MIVLLLMTFWKFLRAISLLSVPHEFYRLALLSGTPDLTDLNGRQSLKLFLTAYSTLLSC